MKLIEYKPLDYKTWILGDEARRGINIKRLNLLTDEELQIWKESVKYQDQRSDPGHGEMTAYFGLKLLDYISGNRKIVVPAAILHDTGWYGIDPNSWKKLVNANKKNLKSLDSEINRRPHQNRGILIAGKVLEKTGYLERNPFSYGLQIADIIGDHDTRKLPINDDGKIVRTADLIWRVTYPALQTYIPNEPIKEVLRIMKETCLSESDLGDIGTKIARIELVNTFYFKFSKQALSFLKKEFEQELKQIPY